MIRKKITEEWLFVPDDDWKRVIWSDESPFELFTYPKTSSIRRKVGERFDKKNLIGTIKFGGGKINVWGCFSYYGVGKLVLINGKMDKFQYLPILKNNLEEFINLSGIENPIFQQDNDPKHTSAIVKKYLEQCDFPPLF